MIECVKVIRMGLGVKGRTGVAKSSVLHRCVSPKTSVCTKKLLKHEEYAKGAFEREKKVELVFGLLQ